MKKLYNIRLKAKKAEELLRGNLNGKVFLTEEGKKILVSVIKEKRV